MAVLERRWKWYLISPFFYNSAIVHHVDVVGVLEDVQCMRDQDSGPRCKRSMEKAVVKNEPPNMSVHGRQWVVQENYVRSRVCSASEGDAGLKAEPWLVRR